MRLASGRLKKLILPKTTRIGFLYQKLGGGNSNIFYFHPYLGKGSNLTNIFQVGWNHQLGKWAAFCQACLGILCSFWWYRPGEFGATVFFWSTDPRSKGFLWIPNCYGKHPFWDLFPAHWAVHQRSQGEGWFLAIQNSLAGAVLLMFPDLVLGIWVDMYTYIYIYNLNMKLLITIKQATVDVETSAKPIASLQHWVQ